MNGRYTQHEREIYNEINEPAVHPEVLEG